MASTILELSVSSAKFQISKIWWKHLFIGWTAPLHPQNSYCNFTMVAINNSGRLGGRDDNDEKTKSTKSCLSDLHTLITHSQAQIKVFVFLVLFILHAESNEYERSKLPTQ
jgi:hypothetical protein